MLTVRLSRLDGRTATNVEKLFRQMINMEEARQQARSRRDKINDNRHDTEMATNKWQLALSQLWRLCGDGQRQKNSVTRIEVMECKSVAQPIHRIRETIYSGLLFPPPAGGGG